MGKLTSYLLGLGIILFISYYYLVAYYNPLIQWLGPMLGAPLIVLFGLLLFLLGNPLKDTFIIPFFIITGVLIGLGSRKGTKAFFSTITIYTSAFMIAGISFFYLFMNYAGSLASLSKLSSSSSANTVGTSGLPPLPPGSSITSILSEPLIGRIVNAISLIAGKSSSSSLSGLSASSMLSTYGSLIFNEFAIYAIEDFLIVAITAMVVGFALNKILGKGKNAESRKKIDTTPLKMGMIVILTLLLVISFSVPLHNSNNSGNKSNVPNASASTQGASIANNSLANVIGNEKSMYSSNSTSYSFTGGFLGKTGSQYNVYGSLQGTNATSANALKVSTSFFSAYFITYNMSNLISQMGIDNIYRSFNLNSSGSNQFSNLLPEGMILYLTNGNSSADLSSTQNAAKSFVNSINGSSLALVLDVSVNLSILKMPNVGIYLFSFAPNYKVVEKSLVNNYNMVYGNSQSGQILKSSISDGNFTPSFMGGETDSFVMAGGYLNSSQIASDITSLTGFKSILNSYSQTYFGLSMFEQNSVYTSSGSKHLFSMAKLINYHSNLSFTGSTGSIIVTGFPVNAKNSNGYEFNIYSNAQPLYNQSGFGNYASYHGISGMLDPNSINYVTNATFPAKLSIVENISSKAGNLYAVSIGVTNKDTDTLANLSINDSEIKTFYGSNIQIVSGSTESPVTKALNPGKTIYLNFTVKAHNPGSYTIGNPLITYENNNTKEVSVGPSKQFSVNKPPVQDTINNLIYFYINTEAGSVIPEAKILTTPLVGYFYLFDLLIVLLLVADIFTEIKAFRKWRAQ